MLMTLRICVTLLLLACPYVAFAGQHKLASSSVDSTYHSIGVALEAAVSIHLTPFRDIKLTSVSTRNARESVEFLSQGLVDFATIPSLLGHQARTGTGSMAGLGPQSEMRAIAMMVPVAYHALLRSQASESGEIEDLFKLPSDRLRLGMGGADAADVTEFLYRHFVVSTDRPDNSIVGSASSQTAGLNDKFDGLIATGSTPVSDVEALMSSEANDLTLLEITKEQLQSVNEGYDLFTSTTIPAGTYPNQPEAIETLALPVFLATRADVDDEVVYQIAKLMFEQSSFLQTIHPAMAALDFETALDNLPVPLHPGAARYFRDYGLSLAAVPSAVPNYPVYDLDADDPERRRIETNTDVVGLMVDPDPTSMQIAGEMAVVVNSSPGDLRVVVQRGEGSARIVNDLLYMKGLDLGIVQADVLEHFRSQEDTEWLPKQLQYLTKLYDREVHVLARGDISGFSDLAGETVNFGPNGSASERTAANIFSHLGITVQQGSDSFEFALEKLKRGDIAALVVSGGKPLTSLTSIDPSSGFKLLNVPVIGDHDIYNRTKLSSLDYPNLISDGEDVRSLSVPAILVTYRWPRASDRYRLLSRFFTIFGQQLDQLQTGNRFHRKWQDVTLEDTFEGWTRSSIASGGGVREGALPETGLPTPRALPLPTSSGVDGSLSTSGAANEPS